MSEKLLRIGPPQQPVREHRATTRGPVFLWGNVIVVGWLAVAALLLVAHEPLGLPTWIALHAFLLGAVTTAIVIWSEHFSVALTHAPEPPQRQLAIGLAVLNVLAVTTLVGVGTDIPVLTGIGGAGIAVLAVVHTVHLPRPGMSMMAGRFSYLIAYYRTASASLVAGAVLGAGLALGGAGWFERIWAAHVHVTLLGWVGLSVLGTMFLLWPTSLGVRMPPGSVPAAKRALAVLAGGLTVAVAGILIGSAWLAALGLAGYAAGIVVALVPMLSGEARKMPRGPAGWMLAAATAWLAVTVLADAVWTLVSGSFTAPVTALAPVLVTGFAAQVLIGALTRLLPVVVGRGPAGHKEAQKLLATGWRARVIAANLAVPLVAWDWPGPLNMVGWGLTAIAVAWFALLALRAALPDNVRGTVLGSVAGGLVTALALVFAVTGTTSAEAPADALTVEVTLKNMRIDPAVVEVPAGRYLILKVTNEDSMTHDLRVDNGNRTPQLTAGQTVLLDVGVATSDMQGWCTIAGHRAAGMTMTIKVAGGVHSGHNMGGDPMAPMGLDPMAPPSPGWTPRDASLDPAPTGTVHKITLPVVEKEIEVAPGVIQRRWTFGGTVPGPVLRGRIGDVFEITLRNEGATGHGVDFHAGALAPDQPMRTIQPGEQLVYRFTAKRAGAWLYHCSTMPMSLHIANGMYGAVIIDPPDLPSVDREYFLVGNEVYLGRPGDDTQTASLAAGKPDGWAFNGMAGQYDHAPLTAKVGERVRFWVINAGPSGVLSFHIVGGQFDAMYHEGAWALEPGGPGGAQALGLFPAQGGFVELAFPEAGHYTFVDHDMRHAEKGAHGVIEVTP